MLHLPFIVVVCNKELFFVGGKYRRDTPWLVEAFRKQGVKSEIVFMTRADTADVLANKYPNTAFFGRVNPMDYDCMSLDEYIVILSKYATSTSITSPHPLVSVSNNHSIIYFNCVMV